jgi:hypothetical protein
VLADGRVVGATGSVVDDVAVPGGAPAFGAVVERAVENDGGVPVGAAVAGLALAAPERRELLLDGVQRRRVGPVLCEDCADLVRALPSMAIQMVLPSQ